MSIGRRVALAVAAVILIAVSVGSVGVGAATAPTSSTSSTSPISFPSRWVHLSTRPALPDATFTLDGVSYTTGVSGTVQIPTSSLTNIDQRLGFVSVVNAPLTRVNFDRFEAGPEVALTRTVVAVFDMSRFLHVTTIPALPNASFVLDGTSHTTGKDGTVLIETNRLTNLGARLKFDSVSTGPDAWPASFDS